MVAPDRLRVRSHRGALGLDNEAAETAQKLGLAYARAATAGTHPAFVGAICDLVREHTDATQPQSLGNLGLCGIACPDGCCPAPRRGGPPASS